MSTIIPAILTNSITELERRLKELEGATAWAQIDIADGVFVTERTIDLAALASITTPIALEAHLMVAHPETMIDDCIRARVKRVIFHLEAAPDPSVVIRAARAHGELEVGIALNPETPIERALPYASAIDLLLLLAVTPGKQGQQFLSETYTKITQAKASMPNIPVAVDGGINEENIVSVIEAGADRCCIGSAIVGSDDPARALRHFQTLALHMES